MNTATTFPLPQELSPVLAESEELSPYQKSLTLAKEWNVSSTQCAQKIAAHTSLPFLSHFTLVEQPTLALPVRLIHEYHCLPIKQEDGAFALATSYPPTQTADRWIYACTQQCPRWFIADAQMIEQTIKSSLGIGSDSLDGSELDLLDEDEKSDTEDQNAAIIKFVNDVIENGKHDRATDIHFEPLEDLLQIRYRIDGHLIPIPVPPSLERYQGAIISRLKVMAKLNISERRRPQDGRIHFHTATSDLDIRISTFPTMYGESVSLRLLNQKAQAITMAETGLLDDDQARVRSVLQRPHGIMLVTGPTGSGKSTSLSSFIRLINEPERRIITVEDPIEYEVPGINQTQINPEIGLNFAAALRHILRQDPDVIMIGEIRDSETADIAIRASQTGHLVMSTLHTNDAAGAFTRLMDMGIEPFQIASTVEMVIAQRLVRKLNLDTVIRKEVDPLYLNACLDQLHLSPSEAQYLPLVVEPNIASITEKTAFRGRVGIFEILRNQDNIHELILRRSSAKEIRNQAIANGMRTIQECGWEQVKRQLTSLGEIMRFAEVGFKEEAE